MNWKVTYKKSVKKDLKKISPDIQYIIKRAIEEKLMVDPLKYGTPLKRNLQGLMKLRVGDYRIIYEIENEKVTIMVGKLGTEKKCMKILGDNQIDYDLVAEFIFEVNYIAIYELNILNFLLNGHSDILILEQL